MSNKHQIDNQIPYKEEVFYYPRDEREDSL